MENKNQNDGKPSTESVGVTETRPTKIERFCSGESHLGKVVWEWNDKKNVYTCSVCGETITEEETQPSEINKLTSTEERLKWCEEYIKILLTAKDESQEMHILDGKDISKMKQRLNRLEAKN